MRLRERLWNPYVLVFVTSGCIMTVELVASRLVAPRMGVSLYTWTSIIGVILGGISVGNYLGGRLSDRYASLTFLGLLLALASLGTLVILALTQLAQNLPIVTDLPIMVRVVGYVAAIYFVPSCLLGSVSPVVAKLCITDLQRTGTTVGKVYAWSSVGSVFGTFATGFWFLSWFGARTIVLFVASLLMVLAIWFVTALPWKRALVRAVLMAAIVAVGWVFLASPSGQLVRAVAGDALRAQVVHWPCHVSLASPYAPHHHPVPSPGLLA